MKTRITPFASAAQTLALVAMAAIATTFTACQTTDEGLTDAIPLVLGEVSVDAPATTNGITRGGVSATRAATTENATTGYTGIRKSRFVAGEKVTLTLDDSSTGGSATRTATATLGADGTWSLGSTPVYIQPGKTVITAAYAATEQITGIAKDDLVAAGTADCVLTGSVLSLAMKHAGGMIDITPASGTATITSIALNAAATTPISTTKEDEESGGVTTSHYRAIASATSAPISTVTAVIGGITYEATLTTPITVAANKRYPIALTFKNSTLTATTGAPQSWTDGGAISGIPAGYDRVIKTPEDLAQFAKDVNSNAAGARTAIVYQTADIDISKLKDVTAAGINPLTGAAYDYTATADNWVPIGSNSNKFNGSYNGNGHTISNVTFTTYPSEYMGLFGNVSEVSLTGIHLRNFQALDNTKTCGIIGALVGQGGYRSIITLCSATGTIKGIASMMGGLIGDVDSGHITRCTAQVNLENAAGSWTVGGLIGHIKYVSNVAGCSVVSNITGAAPSPGGLIGFSDGGYRVPFGCYCGGTMAQINQYIFRGGTSCYSDMTATGFGVAGFPCTDCAYTGASAGVGGVTVNALPEDIYGYLTTGATTTPVAVKTLHWSATDGYTLTVVEKTWKASGIWKNNPGAAPTINMHYEGE